MNKAQVVCYGSLNIDYVYQVDHIVRGGETLASTALDVHVGGKGLNQAVALAKADLSPRMAGAVGTDGSDLIKFAQEAGLDTSDVLINNDIRTGNAIIQVDKNGQNCIVLFGGANRSQTRADVERVLNKMQVDDVLVLQNEVNVLEDLLDVARRQKLRVVLNPSPLDQELLALNLKNKVWLLIVNEIEAADLIGEFESPELAVARLKEEFGSAYVVLTCGSLGAWAQGPEGSVVHADIWPCEVVDTTAAGDTFTGFVLSGILRGMELGAALDMAACASSVTVSRAGASESIPTFAEVEEKLAAGRAH